MATIYLRSTTGSDANDGSTWALAKATLGAAITAAGANGTVYVSQAHSETLGANTTYSLSDGCDVLAVNDSAQPPTALVSAGDASHPIITGDNGASTYTIVINMGHGSIMHGMEFVAGANYTGSAARITMSSVNTYGVHSFKKCRFKCAGTGSWPLIFGGFTAGRRRQFNVDYCYFNFAAAGQSIQPYSGELFITGAILEGTTPTSLLVPLASNENSQVVFQDSDLSSVTGNLVSVASAEGGHDILFMRCKLGAGVALTTGTRTRVLADQVRVENCDSADTNYRLAWDKGQGTVVSETTLVKTGGASDGVTGLSWKMATNANAAYPNVPLNSPQIISEWITATGSAKTVTVDILHDSATALNDDEVWLEIEYLGTSGFPLGTQADDAKADILATAAAQASSTATWTTTGMANPNKQKLSVTFTPQEIGVVACTVKLAKPSKTIYVDPVAQVA